MEESPSFGDLSQKPVTESCVELDECPSMQGQRYGRRLKPAHRKSQTSFHSVISNRSRRFSTFSHTRDIQPDDERGMDFPCNNVQLLHTNRRILRLKNFKEIDARKHLDRFLSESTIILEEKSCNFDRIIDNLICQIFSTSNSLKSSSLELRTEDKERIGNSMFTVAEEMDEHDDCDESDGHWASAFTQDIHLLNETMQACSVDETGSKYQHTWLVAMGKSKLLTKARVGISRLTHRLNLGRHCREVRFVILVLAPDIKTTNPTMSGAEVARTFATLFADINVHRSLLRAKSVEQVRDVLCRERALMTKTSRSSLPSISLRHLSKEENDLILDRFDAINTYIPWYHFGKGMWWDIKNRLPYYKRDWTDAWSRSINNGSNISRVISATIFAFFACFLPTIAFGNTNAGTTDDWLNVEKTIIAQAIGGIFFALFSAQPLMLLLTTAPIALYIKVIKAVAVADEVDFKEFYVAVGLWNSIFLILYALTNCSRVMRFSTRSCEEIFAVFTALAFVMDAYKHIDKAFRHYYNDPETSNYTTTEGIANHTYSSQPYHTTSDDCTRDKAILWLMLALGTLWLGMTFYRMRNSPYMNAAARELCSDYSLAAAVVIMSIVGTTGFSAVKFQNFYLDPNGTVLSWVPVHSLSWSNLFKAAGLGFCMSLLFFMDQGFGEALTNQYQHKLIKPSGYHWDLFIVGVINVFLSGFGLPWIHGALPHSPLHVHALARVEESVDDGHVRNEIVSVAEQRVSSLVSHILIGASVVILPYMTYIPTPVLDGLFLFVAVTSLYGNEFFIRVCLLVTDRAAYPPSHFIRRVPTKIIHSFTAVQLVQLALLAKFGFFSDPSLKLLFPVLIIFLLPIRQWLLPKMFEAHHLAALDDH